MLSSQPRFNVLAHFWIVADPYDRNCANLKEASEPQAAMSACEKVGLFAGSCSPENLDVNKAKQITRICHDLYTKRMDTVTTRTTRIF